MKPRSRREWCSLPGVAWLVAAAVLVPGASGGAGAPTRSPFRRRAASLGAPLLPRARHAGAQCSQTATLCFVGAAPRTPPASQGRRPLAGHRFGVSPRGGAANAPATTLLSAKQRCDDDDKSNGGVDKKDDSPLLYARPRRRRVERHGVLDTVKGVVLSSLVVTAVSFGPSFGHPEVFWVERATASYAPSSAAVTSQLPAKKLDLERLEALTPQKALQRERALGKGSVSDLLSELDARLAQLQAQVAELERESSFGSGGGGNGGGAPESEQPPASELLSDLRKKLAEQQAEREKKRQDIERDLAQKRRFEAELRKRAETLRKLEEQPAWFNYAAAAAASVVSTTVMHPVDTIKTRLMTAKQRSARGDDDVDDSLGPSPPLQQQSREKPEDGGLPTTTTTTTTTHCSTTSDKNGALLDGTGGGVAAKVAGARATSVNGNAAVDAQQQSQIPKTVSLATATAVFSAGGLAAAASEDVATAVLEEPLVTTAASTTTTTTVAAGSSFSDGGGADEEEEPVVVTLETAATAAAAAASLSPLAIGGAANVAITAEEETVAVDEEATLYYSEAGASSSPRKKEDDLASQIQSLYAGVGGNIAKEALPSALYLGVYEAVKSALLRTPTGAAIPLAVYLVAGGAGEVCGSFVRAPAEAVKSLVQAGVAPSFASACEYIVATDASRRRVGRAWSASVWRDVPMGAIQIALFELLKTYILNSPSISIDVNTLQAEAMLGAIGGLVGSVVTTPLDVTTTRIITSPDDDARGSWDFFRDILRDGGPAALFEGALQRGLYWAPAIGIFLSAYCSFRQFAAENPEAHRAIDALTHHVSF